MQAESAAARAKEDAARAAAAAEVARLQDERNAAAARAGAAERAAAAAAAAAAAHTSTAAPRAAVGPPLCGTCGIALEPGHAFCAGCGTRVSQAAVTLQCTTITRVTSRVTLCVCLLCAT